jgi:hypothetical protein
LTPSPANSRAGPRRSLRRWLWVFPLLVVGYATYAWAYWSITERQTAALAERIRATYGLPRSEYHFPLAYLDQIVRDGMTASEVDSVIGPIRPMIKAVGWHTDLSVAGERWVAQRLQLEISGPDLPVDIFFRQGRVANLDSGYYISRENEIPADSAARLLD